MRKAKDNESVSKLYYRPTLMTCPRCGVPLRRQWRLWDKYLVTVVLHLLDILLGCALSALRELNSDTLKAAIPTLPTQSQKKDQRPTSKRVAISVDIVNRQTLKVMPQFLSMEDLSRLWSSLQAKYRPSIAYQISGVLID